MRFNDGSSMRLYRQTIEDFTVYAGMELTEPQMEKLRQAAGAMSAKMRAIRIVAAAGVSKKELEQRLIRKGEDPKQANAAVQWMSDLDLLDDRKTAEQVVHRCIAKGYGISRAKQALYEKRIPKDIWDDVLADYPDQMDTILSFLRDKMVDANDPRQLRKVIDALIRRGHSYSRIRRALDELAVDADIIPED